MSGCRRRLRRAGALVALLAPLLLPAVPADASTPVEVRGTAHCATKEPVEGVRVVTTRRISTAAIARGLVPHVAYWSVVMPSDSFPSDVRIAVRCGGRERVTPGRRISTWSSSPTSTQTTMNAICDATSCRYPRVKDAVTTNSYQRSFGECTYGAAEKFLSATGVFPRSISGDAREWTATAAAGGWDIYRWNPVPRSLVVFQPGDYGSFEIDGRGHVGWVTRVERRSDGVYVTFHEMNGEGGFARWSDPLPTVKHGAGMSYVVAPAPQS